MGKKPLVGWVGFCGIGILMTGCCNNPSGRQQTFANGRADASAGLTSRAWNRPPQNATAGNTAGSTDSMSGTSSVTGNQFNTTGMTNSTTATPNNPWGASQGMGATGGMPMPNGGGMMQPTGAGTPVSYNGSPLQQGGGMNGGANNVPVIPSNARFVGNSTHTSDLVQTGGSMNDALAVTNAGGSRQIDSVDSNVRQAMATNSDLNSIPHLPPAPPIGGGGSSSSWNSSGMTGSMVPPPPSDPALGNSPPPVNSMSTKGLPGSSAASSGPSNGLGNYMNTKGP